MILPSLYKWYKYKVHDKNGWESYRGVMDSLVSNGWEIPCSISHAYCLIVFLLARKEATYYQFVVYVMNKQFNAYMAYVNHLCFKCSEPNMLIITKIKWSLRVAEKSKF